MDRIKKLKVKQSDGTYTDYIPLGVDASNVDLDDGSNAQDAIDELQGIVINSSAAAHNGYYRGKDLTSYFTSGQMTTDLAKGDFSNIFPGDYITMTKTIDGTTYTNHTDIIAECDPYYSKWSGSAYITTHHVGIIPFDHLGSAEMNTTNTTVGGFEGSAMWTTTLPEYLTGYEDAYGESHLLDFGFLMTESINSSGYNKFGSAGGCSSGWEWVNTKIALMSENQVYGGQVWSSSGYDTGEAQTQLACFKLRPELTTYKTSWWWLRGVASAADFCLAANGGRAYCNGASCSYGVRPLLLLK